MKKSSGKIEFEYRYEVDEVLCALDLFVQEHPEYEHKETIDQLRGLLDVMYVSW